MKSIFHYVVTVSGAAVLSLLLWRAIERRTVHPEQIFSRPSEVGKSSRETRQPAVRLSTERGDFVSASKQLNSQRRAELMHEYVLSVPASEAGALFERIRAVGPGVLRAEWLAAFFPEWASIDPAAAMQAAESLEEDTNKSAMAVLGVWAGNDIEGALGWYGAHAPGDLLYAQAKEVLTRVLLAQDPAQAIGWIQSSGSAAVRRELSASFFCEWAKTDPAGAGRGLLDRTAPLEASAILGEVVDLWCRTDSGAAVQWVESLPESALRAQALSQARAREELQIAHGKWAVMDPAAASKWAESLPEGKGKEDVRAYLATVWTQRSPELGAQYAATLPAGTAQTDAVISVVSTWADKFPEQAASWVERFPEGSLRNESIERLAALWARRDSAAAKRWAEHAGAIRARDNGVAN